MGPQPSPRHPRANRPLAAGLTAVVLGGVLAMLVYGFAPDLPRQIARAALTAINLDPPKPRPAPPPPPAHRQAGASGAAGKMAVAAPKTIIAAGKFSAGWSWPVWSSAAGWFCGGRATCPIQTN